jgi:hypothetical protein
MCLKYTLTELGLGTSETNRYRIYYIQFNYSKALGMPCITYSQESETIAGSLLVSPTPQWYLVHLFGALVDLGQERLKDLLLQASGLVHSGNLGAQLSDNLLLIVLVQLLQLKVVEDLLDLGLLLLVLAAVGGVQHRTLLGGGTSNGLVDQPGALVVLNVGADLANDCGVTEVVQVVILDLEVLAQRDQDIVSLLQGLWGSDLQIQQGKGDGQVEAVVGRLVGDNEHVLLHGEVVEVDIVLGGGDQIAKLTQLGLPSGLVEELDEVDVGGVGLEALLEDEVDGRLEHESVVDGNETDTLLAVPAGLATASDRAVHNIIANEEESLEQLGEPAQDAEVLELLLGQGLLQEGETGVGDRETAVELATGGVREQRLLIY